MRFQQGLMEAEIYKAQDNQWRIKHNCSKWDYNFHIQSFVYPYPNSYELSNEWNTFLIESVRTFRLVVNPYNKNVTLTHPRPLFDSEW